MAIVTRIIGSMADDLSGLIARIELDYDDIDLRARVIRVINPTQRAVVIEAARADRSRVYSQEFPAGQTTTLAIPTTPAGRLQGSIDGQGRFDGIAWATRWVVA